MAVRVKQHKGAWWIFINHKGKRKAKKVGSSKRAADEVAGKIEAKLKLGDFSLLDEKTHRPFDTYYRNWLETYVKAHCKERTYDLYADAFRVHLLPRFGQKDITAITREEVKALAYGLLAQDRGRGTVKMTLAPLSEMFNHAIEDGRITVNPVHRIFRKSRKEDGAQQQKTGFLTREELGLLLRTCQEHFSLYYPFLSLLARTGLRFGEAVGLQWGDIDFQGRFIEVRRTLSHDRISTPKSGKGRRVDMSLQLTETLKSLHVERKKETLRKGWGEVPL